MFELADRLVGIYKTNDATKSVTINPAAFDDAINSNTNNNNTSMGMQESTSKEDTVSSDNTMKENTSMSSKSDRTGPRKSLDVDVEVKKKRTGILSDSTNNLVSQLK
jgi:hypothetical protein